MDANTKMIGKYEIRRILGEGASGTVFEGYDPDIDRKVAIKTLHEHVIVGEDGQEFLARFKREAQSAAKCMHPNIVTVLEFGQHQKTPYLVMEYIHGTPLDALIKTDQAFNLKTVLNIIGQLLKALNKAHGLNIVHRDIKPANIMVLPDGSIKLADFGVARLPTNSELTQIGVMIGTPRYMAPEQAFGLPTDHRADLFAVAMVLLILLQCLPKKLNIPKQALTALQDLPANNRINYEIPVPTAFVDVISKGLSAKADQRYQSAKEFAAAIREAVNRLKQSTQDTSQAAQQTLEDDSPPIVQSISSRIDPGELTLLKSIFADYAGSDAEQVINQEVSKHTYIDELVTVVAKELGAKEAQQFLKQWDGRGLDDDSSKFYTDIIDNEQTGNSFQTSLGGSDLGFLGNAMSQLDADAIEDLKDDFAKHVGGKAAQIVDEELESNLSYAEFIYSLGNHIDNKRKRQKFIDLWISR